MKNSDICANKYNIESETARNERMWGRLQSVLQKEQQLEIKAQLVLLQEIYINFRRNQKPILTRQSNLAGNVTTHQVNAAAMTLVGMEGVERNGAGLRGVTGNPT